MPERLARQHRGDLRPEARGRRVLVHDETPAGALHGGEHGGAVPRHDRPQVEQVHVARMPIGRLDRPVHHRAPRDDGHAIALTQNVRPPERQDVVVPRIACAAVAGHQQRSMLEEDRRIRAPHRRSEQAHRVGGVRRHRHLPTDGVRPCHLATQRMPGIADVLAESARHPHHHRRGELVRRAPPHRSDVVELLVRGIGILAELNLRDGHESAHGHADGATDDALLGQTRIEHTPHAEPLLQSFRHEMHAALPPDVLPEDDELRIRGELAGQRSTHRFREPHHVPVLVRRFAAAQRRRFVRRESTERRPIARPRRLGVDEPLHGRRIGNRARARRLERGVDVSRDLRLERSPLRVAQQRGNEMTSQPRQGIARRVGGDLLVRAVALLVVGSGVAGEARHRQAHQRRSSTAAHVVHALGEDRRRTRRIAPVSIAQEEVAERAEIRRDVPAGRLHVAPHRDPEPVVLDVEEHRQLERRRHRERRPEAVGGHRRLSAQREGNAAIPAALAQLVAMIGDGLRPPRRGRVLRADVASHRQDRRPGPPRQVAHDADVAAITEAARAAQRAAQRIIHRQSERQEERARAIIGAHAIVCSVDERAENALRDVVSPRRELIQHHVLARHAAAIPIRCFLQIVEGSRRQHGVRDPPPVESRIDAGIGRGRTAVRGLCGWRHRIGDRSARVSPNVGCRWRLMSPLRGANGSASPLAPMRRPSRRNIFPHVPFASSHLPRAPCPSCTSSSSAVMA